jgi:hypothetical protein
MWKGLLLLVVLAGAGYLVYHVLAKGPPEERACERMAELCPGADGMVDECEKTLRDLDKAVGGKAAEKAAECTAESESCAEAMGCVGGSFMNTGAKEFLKGLERSLSK